MHTFIPGVFLKLELFPVWGRRMAPQSCASIIGGGNDSQGRMWEFLQLDLLQNFLLLNYSVDLQHAAHTCGFTCSILRLLWEELVLYHSHQVVVIHRECLSLVFSAFVYTAIPDEAANSLHLTPSS